MQECVITANITFIYFFIYLDYNFILCIFLNIRNYNASKIFK